MDDPADLPLIQLDHVTYLTGCEAISGNERTSSIETVFSGLISNAFVVESLPERNSEFLFLSEKDAESSGLTMKETIEAVEEAFRGQREGKTIVPTKISMDLSVTGKHNCGANALPSYVGASDVVGIKWIGSSPDNASKGLPSNIAIIILNDPSSMAPIAALSGTWITAMRTGAATAVATKYLARKDSETVCIVGAGYQAAYQIMALNEVVKIRNVRVADKSIEARERFSRDMSKKLGLSIEPAQSVEQAVRGADIIVTITTADEPLVKGESLKRGCFISSAGAYQEVDYSVTKSMDKIVVDHLEQSMHMGELGRWVSKGLMSSKDVYAELGEVVAGKKAGRENDTEEVMFVTVGVGSSDVATAERVYRLAKKKGLGQWLRWR